MPDTPSVDGTGRVPRVDRISAVIALPAPHPGLAAAALRSCLKQLLLDRSGDQGPRGRTVVDWLTFRTSGPVERPGHGDEVWFVYTGTADVASLDHADRPGGVSPG